MFSWCRLHCIALLFCCSIYDVLARKRELGPGKLADWKWKAGTQGPGVDMWDDHKRHKRLSTILATEVCPNCSSWFITPLLNLPDMSYLALGAECDPYPCQLQIYGTSDSSPDSMIFRFIQNVTFETRTIENITIEGSFLRLQVLARPSTQKTMFIINSINVFYFFCESTTKYNGNLSEVKSSRTNISKQVQCLDNSFANDGKSRNMTVLCTPEGEWIVRDQECVCDKGFYNFHSHHQGCPRCPIHYYKSVIGNTNCKKCPDGKTNSSAHTTCECKKDHYIGVEEDPKCYAVPPPVENLSVETLTSTSVNITWGKPKIPEGSEELFTYNLECYHCINGSKCYAIVENLKFFPAKTNLNATYVVVSGLKFGEKYKLKVTSINNWLKNVSSDKWMFKSTDFSLSALSHEAQESSKNSPGAYFISSTVAVCVVSVILIVIVAIYKKRERISKLTTLANTDEMANQSGTEIWQNNLANHYENPDEPIYETPNDGETERYEEVENLPSSVYTELSNNRRQEGEARDDNNYQELLEHDSGYLNPVEIEPYKITDILSGYTELNKIRQDERGDNSYQKLIKHSSDNDVPARTDAEL